MGHILPFLVGILLLPLRSNFVCRSGFRDASLPLLNESRCRWNAGLWCNAHRQPGAVTIIEHEWGYFGGVMLSIVDGELDSWEFVIPIVLQRCHIIPEHVL
jgi:hypothetical protein